MKPGLEDYLFFSISFLFFLVLLSLFLHPLSETYVGKLLAFNQNCYQLVPPHRTLLAPGAVTKLEVTMNVSHLRRNKITF